MQNVIDLYATQPYWFWLALGAALLALEASLTTEWLLWPAVAAGIIAVLTFFGLRFGFLGDAGLFAVFTIITTMASSRLIKRVNPADAPDINDPNERLVGQRARVVEAFVDGRGRVFVSGAEWSAEISGEAPPVGDSVIVVSGKGAALKVRVED